MSKVICNHCEWTGDTSELQRICASAGRALLVCPKCCKQPARFRDAPDLVCDCIDGKFVNGRRV